MMTGEYEETRSRFLKPINNTSVVQKVIDQLTLAMIHKELRPGDKIPTEVELSESFGVGRNSVREAIKILVSFGVLEIKRPEGTFVTGGFSDKMLDPLLYGIILDESDSMDSLKELREWLDTGMLLLAAKKSDAKDVKNLERAFEVLREKMGAGDDKAAFDADNVFHDVMAEITHNPLFSKIGKLVRLLTYEIRRRTFYNMTKTQEARDAMVQVHYDIFEAIRSRDTQKAAEIIKGSYFYERGVLDD
ncbi:MAG: FadR/GntR family transcriptional regulator [Centipeda sp. (in: firmicutes)]